MIYLPSNETIDIHSLLNTLIECKWGIQKLKCIIVFGSAVRPMKTIDKEVQNRFLFWKYTSTIRKWDKPNDIDLLMVYDKNIPKAELEKEKHHTNVDVVINDGYGGILKHGTRESNLHMFRISSEDFERNLDQGEKYAKIIFDEGIVIWGKNSLVTRECPKRKYIYNSDYYGMSSEALIHGEIPLKSSASL